MWLRYQQVTSKMASFNPREIMQHRDSEEVKFPLKRFEPTLRTSLRMVIPMNLDRLRKHKVNIEKFAHLKNWKDLNREQINASRTVQQLKATIRDLEKIKGQIVAHDLNEFERLVTPMKNESVKSFQEFSQLQDIISVEVQKSIFADNNIDYKDGVSDTSQDNLATDTESSTDSDMIFSNGPITRQIQLGGFNEDQVQDEMDACQSWDHLRGGLMELNELVKDFAVVVHHQQEVVDNIEENIETAHENVSTAATLLAQASKYKVAIIPVAGAVVGGLIGGPIGLLAGFKLAGAAAAVGGGVVGYQGGKYLKKKHDGRVDMELQNLSKNEVG